MQAYDVLVIGSGPAGEKAAFQAAKLGKRVGLVTRSGHLGGNCLHTATIPSKTLRETALHIAGIKQGALQGIQCTLRKDVKLEALLRRKDSVIQSQVEVLERKLDRNDVDLITGNGSFLDPHCVRVIGPHGEQRDYEAAWIVIATGSRPAHDPAIPFDGEAILDSDTILQLDELPRSLTVVGAGVIGCEYACMLAHLGTKVTLVDGRARILDFADREISDMLVYRMRKANITLRLGEEVVTITRLDPKRVVAQTKSGRSPPTSCSTRSVGRAARRTSVSRRSASPRKSAGSSP